MEINKINLGSILIQDASRGNKSQIFNGITKLVTEQKLRSVKISVAYVSYGGCFDLFTELEKRVSNWKNVKKDVLLSIDYGSTEPKALRYLKSIPNCTIRAHNSDYVLKHKLFPQVCFHPKTYVLENSNGVCGLFLTSANMTRSGLHQGVEHAISLSFKLNTNNIKSLMSFYKWWRGAWASSKNISNVFINQYEKLIPKRPREDNTPSVKKYFPKNLSYTDITWRNSEYFWIKTKKLYKNMGQNKFGNQLDMKKGTRVFFGFAPKDVVRNTVLGNIKLSYKNSGYETRSLRFGNNQMDKINLPIGMGNVSYDNSYLLFKRIKNKKFTVLKITHKDIDKFKNESLRLNKYYHLVGGREYGFV
jgi:HKD family nuclease